VSLGLGPRELRSFAGVKPERATIGLATRQDDHRRGAGGRTFPLCAGSP